MIEVQLEETGGRKTDVILLIDELFSIQNRCPAEEDFKCGGTQEAPRRNCITCWLDYAWYLANGKNPYLRPRDKRA